MTENLGENPIGAPAWPGGSMTGRLTIGLVGKPLSLPVISSMRLALVPISRPQARGRWHTPMAAGSGSSLDLIRAS